MKKIIEYRINTSIETAQGIADYSHTEVEDNDKNWDDHWLVSNGEYVIHDENQHHIYLLRRADYHGN